MNEKKPKAAEAAFSAKSGELRTLAEETITEWFNEKLRAIAAHCRRDEIHTTAETKGLSDKRNPMEPVNKVHRFLELFLKRHGGYKREEFQGWLNLFAFWYNTPGTAMEKAIKFIEMAVKKRKMLRYRAWGSKKHDED